MDGALPRIPKHGRIPETTKPPPSKNSGFVEFDHFCTSVSGVEQAVVSLAATQQPENLCPHNFRLFAFPTVFSV
jgi:hypothetical protein